jgi:precorrin-6B methylase 2
LAEGGSPQEELNVPESDRTVPYVPTPPEVVKKMLDMAKVGPSDLLYDLGSGDGRIVIMAAEKYGARAVGVELDEGRFKESSARLVELGLANRAKILRGNFFETDVRPATVVTLYLLPDVNQRLRPHLEKQLRAGARVVSHNYSMDTWNAAQEVNVTSEDGVEHTIFLYVMPQPPAGNK